MPEDTLHVSSLRPTPTPFSTRRLLNWASLAVAAVLLLALVTHWLPSVLPAQPTAQPTSFSFAPLTPAPINTSTTRGISWKSIGPNWAQEITFSSDGALGYVCGALGPGNAPVLVSRFDASSMSQNSWQTFTNSATGNDCQIAVSPVDANDVVLSVDDCPIPNAGNCSDGYPESAVYRSHDGGATWSQLRLPAISSVSGIAWVGATLFLTVESNMVADSTTITPNTPAHLLVSREDGRFTEITAQQLLGHSTQLNNIVPLSTGSILYVGVSEMSCDGYCTTWHRTSDAGKHWTQFLASYQGIPIAPQTAQPNSNVLVGWSFLPDSATLEPLRSSDSGAHWATLPPFPANPSTGGANIYILPNGTIYAFCYGDASVVYALRAGATSWQTVATLPDGSPLAVQSDATGHAVTLWGQAQAWSAGSLAPGLEYNPLVGNAG